MTLQTRYDEMPEIECEQIHFMCRRLGFDHFVFAGYDSTEFEKHIRSKGLYDFGAPKIGVYGSLAGIAYIVARILCDFPFSYELRRAVHSIVNTVETERLKHENTEDPEAS